MRFATWCIHLPLAQSRKPITQTHLEIIITIWFATLCVHFPLTQRHHPQPSTTSIKFPNNTASPWKPLITFPKNIAPPSTTQHHLKATIILILITYNEIPQKTTPLWKPVMLFPNNTIPPWKLTTPFPNNTTPPWKPTMPFPNNTAPPYHHANLPYHFPINHTTIKIYHAIPQ